MTLFKNILVAVDGSPYAAEALRIAVDLARHYQARLTIVHVYEPAVHAFPGEFMLDASAQAALTAQAENLLAAAKAEAEKAGAKKAETKLLDGVAVSEIVSFAKDKNYDLIAMGTHGRSGLSHVLMGSVAERVVRRAPCPVLTVRLPLSA